MNALRIGIVGARRARQGLGPFVARDLAALGAEVTHVLGRTEESARAAATEIAGQTSAKPVPLSEPDEFDAAPSMPSACSPPAAITSSGSSAPSLRRGTSWWRSR